MAETARYRVVRLIAEGGMGEVYEGRLLGDFGFERPVAIKRIRSSLDGDEHLQAFIDEARIASRLSHPNIVSVLDFGSLEGRPVQIMELVAGENLAELVERARRFEVELPADVALHIAKEIATGLHFAHSEGTGIVHRDVCPNNVLLSWQGEVKVTDFGIAYAHDRLAPRTRVGVIKGRLDYMAPEQIRGERVDARADIFSLGCVLHEMLTGRSALVDGEIQIDPRLRGDARKLVARATETSRSDRFATADEMARGCEAARRSHSTEDPRLRLRDWLKTLEPKPQTERSAAKAVDIWMENFEFGTASGEETTFSVIAAGGDTAESTASRTGGFAEETTEGASESFDRSDRPTSSDSRPVVYGALFLVIVSALAGAAFFVVARSAPDRSRSTTTTRPEVPAERPLAIQGNTAPEPELPVEEDRPVAARRKLPKKEAPPPSMEALEKDLARQLRKADLDAADFSRLPQLLRAYAGWREAKREDDNKAAAAALDDLRRALSSQPVDAVVLGRRFRRTRTRLESAEALPPAELSRLEARFLDLREQLTPDTSAPALETLAQRLRALDGEIAKALSASRAVP